MKPFKSKSPDSVFSNMSKIPSFKKENFLRDVSVNLQIDNLLVLYYYNKFIHTNKCKNQ